jgi:succinyl-CoA synthetase beta subunit
MPQLDVGGGATADAVKKAFELLLSSPNVKSIFVNICKLSPPLRLPVVRRGRCGSRDEL